MKTLLEQLTAHKTSNSEAYIKKHQQFAELKVHRLYRSYDWIELARGCGLPLRWLNGIPVFSLKNIKRI
jgi:hypothetical protein